MRFPNRTKIKLKFLERKIKDIKSIAQKYDLSFNMKDKKDALINNIILDLSNNYLKKFAFYLVGN